MVSRNMKLIETINLATVSELKIQKLRYKQKPEAFLYWLVKVRLVL